MQTKLRENSNFFERVVQLIDCKGFTSLNNFAIKGLGYSSPEKLNRLKDGNNKPSVGIIEDIANRFEDVDVEWLLLGKGEMLKTTSPKPEPIATDNETRLWNMLESQQQTIRELSKSLEKAQQTINELTKSNGL